MKQFNIKKGIKDIDDYNDYASYIFEDYLEGFTKENGLIRDVREDDILEDYERITFVYTMKGMRLAEKMRDKLWDIGLAHFPEDEFDISIQTHLYID